MSFEGFIVEYLLPPKGRLKSQLAILHCLKCGAQAPREADYMREVCTEIRCPHCGNHAVRTSEVNPEQ